MCNAASSLPLTCYEFHRIVLYSCQPQAELRGVTAPLPLGLQLRALGGYMRAAFHVCVQVTDLVYGLHVLSL